MTPLAPLPLHPSRFRQTLPTVLVRVCRPCAAQVEMAESPVVLTQDEYASEEPVPEQEKPEAAAPNLAVPTAGQLKTITPAPGAPLEPPDMVLTKEQTAKRAAQLERMQHPPATSEVLKSVANNLAALAAEAGAAGPAPQQNQDQPAQAVAEPETKALVKAEAHASKVKAAAKPMAPMTPTAQATAEALTIRLLESLAAKEERVSRPTLSHSERRRSGQRGMSRALLFGVKAFYAQRGALDTSMQDIVNERSFTFSACELTKSTGLSLTYQERNII